MIHCTISVTVFFITTVSFQAFVGHLQAWLLWPVLVWGFMVVIGNSIGYVLLAQVPGPVAMFNAVNYVKVGLVAG